MVEHIKLYGDQAERFQEIKADLEEKLGYEPSNPKVVDKLFAALDS